MTYFPFVGGAEVAVKEITDRIGKTPPQPSPQSQPYPNHHLGGEGIFYSPSFESMSRACRGKGGRGRFEFDLITAKLDKKFPSYERIGNVNVYRVGYGWKIDKYLYPWLAFKQAVKLHRQKKYNIAQAIMANYAGLAALLFKLKNKDVKYLLTEQSGDSDFFIFIRTWFWYPLYKMIYTKADYVQVISRWLERRVRKYGYKGEIEIVPNGVDIKKFSIFNFQFPMNDQFSISNFRRQIGVKEKDKVIITVSRLVKKNGVEDLIKSVKEIEKFPPEADQPLAEEIGNWKLVSPHLQGVRGCIKLLIAGTGKLENKLRRLTKELNLQDNVIFLGNIGHNELPQYLWASDIFCRPSLSEGLGISFLEAMAAGLPVVATPVGGIPDFLKDGETGLFCKAGNPESIATAVVRLLSDEILYDKIVENGRRLVEEKYDWDGIVGEMGNIYNKLV